MRLRFRIAYGLLAAVAAAAVALTVAVVQMKPAPPVAPGAVKVVRQFMFALSTGDTRTACTLFRDLPACAQHTRFSIDHYEIFPAEYTVDGVAVRVTMDDTLAEIDLTRNSEGAYRITGIVADPSANRPPPEPVA